MVQTIRKLVGVCASDCGSVVVGCGQKFFCECAFSPLTSDTEI